MSKRKRPLKQGRLVREPAGEYSAARRLSATEAARNFSELLNRVRYRGERFVIERGGVAIGELRPTAPVRFTGHDLLALLRSLPPVDDEFFDAVEEAARNQPRVPESPWEH
jgi:antitoxin (DNA-binding transcriptional repressor) of toxin-antitoxin stability system